jgi:hypothetical protein
MSDVPVVVVVPRWVGTSPWLMITLMVELLISAKKAMDGRKK